MATKFIIVCLANSGYYDHLVGHKMTGATHLSWRYFNAEP